MKNKKVLFIAQTAGIAAMYAALTYAQNLLLPGTTSAAVQFRGPHRSRYRPRPPP